MEPRRRPHVGDCYFAIYYDSQIGHGMRDRGLFCGRPYKECMVFTICTLIEVAHTRKARELV